MKQSDILLRSGMWKIQNEKNTTKFEKQTLRFEIKKEKISTLQKNYPISKRKIISLNLHLQTDRCIVHVSVKRIGNEKDQTLYQRHCFYVRALFPPPRRLCTLYSFQQPPLGRIDPPLPILIRWFPARATEVEVLACRRCSINLSLARHLRDCVRAICYALERGWQRIRIIGLLLMNCVQNIRRCNNYANKYSIIRRRLDNREVSSFFHDDNLLAISREIIIE